MSRDKAVDFSDPSIGGKKVAHPVPEKREKEIDFSSIGGKCVRKASGHPTAESAESVEKEDDARE